METIFRSNPDGIGSIPRSIGCDRHVIGLDQARVGRPCRRTTTWTAMVLSEVVRSTKWVVDNAKNVEIVEEGERRTR